MLSPEDAVTASPSARSPRQVLASRQNGARSTGPKSPGGKIASSANATVHGLSARALLLPEEDLDSYRATIAGCAESLGPRTAAEAFIVAQVGDCLWRQQRLARLEQELWKNEVEDRLKKTDFFVALSRARDALAGVGGIVSMAEKVSPPFPREHVAQLLPALRRVVDLAGLADAPPAHVAALQRPVDGLLPATLLDPGAEEFRSLAGAARALADELRVLEAEHLIQLEVERERLMETAILGDGRQLRMLDRHRARLARELEAHLRLLEAMRCATVESAGPGSIVIEVRVLGRDPAQASGRAKPARSCGPPEWVRLP